MIHIHRFVFNPFDENTYIIWDAVTREAAVIDPGMSTPYEDNKLDDFITNKELKVKAILLTHVHIDHTFGVEHMKEKYDAPLMANQADEFLGQRRLEQARMFHLPMELQPIVFDRFIDEGEVLQLGDNKVYGLHAPGHSPGSLLYYIPDSGILLTGDVLFQRSIGRTDLPGGNYGQLVASINKKIVELPPSTIVYPGHGPETTIADEVRHNPYF
ncbi:MAG: MBL fold metallo-hydrolase [Muribaculaceae bacterium]|nr:MBL fold metallo-hydrolase [Muribaculaceae bacterium]